MNRVTSRGSRMMAVVASVVAVLAIVVALTVALPQAALAGPTTTTTTYNYTGSTATFTVPAGITALTLTVVGGEGGNGGADATPAPPTGGYRGVVTGAISVTPGQQLTVAVGNYGGTGASEKNSNTSPPPSGGTNPLGQYNGGTGGEAGANGGSGFGGAGGAASVVQVSGASIIAGGGGGNGGSGQYASTRGHDATSTYTGRTDTTSTNGQTGQNANDVCAATNCSNNDGGGSGAGGGGAQGGAHGDIEFGAGSSNEWYGFGGSVGQNSTASFAGLSASYQYYSDNSTAGSVTISYTTGSPAAPTAVSGTAGNASASLLWTAPTNPGQAAITDYVVEYSSNGGSTWSNPVDMGSTATSGTVTGLTNGTGYVFEVAAVNSVGTGLYSLPSATVTPLGPPSAPTISAITPQDGALGLTLTPPSSGAAVTGYDYQVGGGSWVSVASTSTSIVIPGLVNGTSYSIAVRAESAVGPGSVSSPVSGTPQAVPGAPTISALGVGNGSLTLSFTPGFNGGGAISSYQYQLNGGAWVTANGTSSPITITGLASGTTYSVALRAVNASGPGAASAPASATTPATPGAPTVTSVVAGDQTATVNFTPGTTGGAPINHYQYQTTSGGSWTDVSASASPVVITGLTNGVTYNVSIRAVNSAGTGAASTPTAVTPATVPGAPTIVGNTVAGSNQQLSAAFTAPLGDGGSPITGYQYSTDGGSTWLTRGDSGGTQSPVVITALSSDGTTPLVNGTTYYVELRAVNAIGVGTASATATGIATTVPSAPVISAVTGSSGALGVTFTAGSNGGSQITGYRYSTDGGLSWTDTGTLGTSFAISGLTNGQSYPVQVEAINSVGIGAASASVSGTPVGLPGQPSIGSVVRSNQTLTASVSLADNGGSPITAWQYSTDGGATWATASGTSSPLTITALSSNTATRLSNGTGYALQVRAVTAIGTGPASATTIVAPASAPAAPSIAVTPGSGLISVAFTLGTDGGSPITELDYSLDGGTTWITPGTLSSPFSISGLTNGTAYSVLLRADNAIGSGAPSVPASTAPRTVPGAPTSVAAVSDTNSADVSWSVPASNGGSTITGYTASAYTSGTAATAVSSCTTTGATSCSITGLTDGTAYYVQVTAANVAGTGAASTPRVLVTPLARPAAPTLSSLTMGDGSTSVAFTAGNAGDDPITGYQYSLDGGSTWQTATGTTSPILITGLTDGTAYTIALRAVSAAGVGATSNTLQGTPYTYPSYPDPSTVIANGGNGQITVSWAAANLQGGTLLNYIATAFTGSGSGSTAGTCTTATLTCVITGLSNGTTYYISMETENTAQMYSQRSTPRVPATPSMQPGAPTAVSGVGGNGSATVSWTAPMSTGASAITGYTVWCSANGGSYTQCTTASAGARSATVTGLTNGTSYTFVVYATNSNGTGPASAASSSVTPLGTGTVPTLSTAVPTSTGFTSTITNYDSGTTYSAVATNGASVTLSGSNITVTGLSNGASSQVTVTATKSTYTTTAGTVTGSALLTGTTPTFSINSPTTTGFTFTITNYDSGSTYSLSATNGATVSRSGSSVTVSGLTLGGTSAVTVQVAKTGSTTVSAVDSGAAMVTGTAPTFSGMSSTAAGFTFVISNYNPSLTYTFAATNGATATQSAGTVTVTGLSNGSSSQVTVTATNPGVSVASANQTGSALLTGTAPTFSANAAMVTGFSFTITNYDSGSTYSLSATNGATVSRSGSGVMVSGLPVGGTSAVTVQVAKSGYTTVSAVDSGAAMTGGTAPTFSGLSSTGTGFTFAIANYDPSITYSFSATDGATVSQSGGTVTVTGLTDGASSQVTVTATNPGVSIASATETGSALTTGTAPTFSANTSTSTGFTFTITNYDSGSTYVLSATNGATVSRSGSTVTVSGLALGGTSAVTVQVAASGSTTVSAVDSGAAMVAGTAPTFSGLSSTATGFTFVIANYDPSLTYTFASTNGATATQSAGTVTVTGLSNGSSSQVTVTATNPGVSVASANETASALLTGITPLFSAPTPTVDGFTFTISNFDSAGSYALAPTTGSATRTGSAVTVTGLAAGASDNVTVTVSHSGYTDATATATGAALIAGTAPAFADVTATGDGFTFTISNYDPSLTYTTSLNPNTGLVSIASDGTGVVSGESAGTAVTLEVTATDPGVSTASASTGATVLLPTALPQLSSGTPLAGGYSFTILNFDPSLMYSFSESHGGTVVRTGSTVTVSGLGASVFSETVVSASSAGHTTVTATASGTSFPDGTAPQVSAVTRTPDGFTFTLTLVPGDTYAVTSGSGTVTLVGSTVTVTGLAPGASTTVHITASASGTLDETSDVAGTAEFAGVVPVLSAATAASGGFFFTISNYSSDFTYTLATTAGTATGSGSLVTVVGLRAGAAATVTVTASRDGYLDASASVTGHAQAATSSGSTPPPPASGDTPPSVPDAPSPTTSPELSTGPSGSGSHSSSTDVGPIVDSAPGAGAVMSGGSMVHSTVTNDGQTVTVAAAGNLGMSVAAKHGGASIPVGADGIIQMVRGDTLWVRAWGLQPQSVVTFWSESAPTKLGSVRSDVTGSVEQEMRIPGSVAPGVHTIVVSGLDAKGSRVSMQLGIRLLDATTASSVTPFTGWLIPLVVAILILVLLLWLLIARRRRREEEV